MTEGSRQGQPQTDQDKTPIGVILTLTPSVELSDSSRSDTRKAPRLAVRYSPASSGGVRSRVLMLMMWRNAPHVMRNERDSVSFRSGSDDV